MFCPYCGTILRVLRLSQNLWCSMCEIIVSQKKALVEKPSERDLLYSALDATRKPPEAQERALE